MKDFNQAKVNKIGDGSLGGDSYFHKQAITRYMQAAGIPAS